MPSRTIRRSTQRCPREKRALEREVDRGVEIGVVQHDLRILATHFELHFREPRGAAFGDAFADGLRAGEADRVDSDRPREQLASTEPRPMTRLNTPAGMPALAMISR